MSQNTLKKAVAYSALKYVQPDSIIGVGTGSTVSYFIEALGTIKEKIKGVVSSSEDSTQKLKQLGIDVIDANQVDYLDIYVDGADEINRNKQMIKGGGAALTREKIIAAIAKTFVCIVDQSKMVDILGQFPLPIEVIPMARSYVSREMVKLGGIPRYRQGIVTDNGNVIIDVHDLKIFEPIALENKINNIVGVVTAGLFANRGANVVLIGDSTGVTEIK